MTGKPLRVLSLGAGVQSSTLALMIAAGEVEMVDCAIFADTQAEPAAVYEWLKWLTTQLPFPVHIVTAGNLWASASTVRRTRDGQRTYVSTGIPVYTTEGLRKGLGKRQCTRSFKIDPIVRKCRELLGLKRVPAKPLGLVDMLMGISTDEASRMKPAVMEWIAARFPLIDAGMSRDDCLRWMADHGYPRPPRSACTFCPFHDDAEWLALTDAEFADAAAKEIELQAAYSETTEMRGTPFFHASRVPLGQAILNAMTEPAQLNFFNNECEGMCGV